MKKQLSFLVISLSWVIWFIAVFAFPVSTTSTHTDFSHDSVSNHIQLSANPLSAGIDILKIPEFKVDWSLNYKLNSDYKFELISPYKAYLSPSFFKKSLPLFDVKDTFIHFFYTW
ncbi:hypothetical protein [Algoriphagus winogradskyi]|uniref:Uncharacterized protein n=1 Tax=Algoriphagus winogradskyi TaxID=237017 RepID=A0ABY1N8Z0_9BACT|nr:hypothetical protein [Algoriphagus winogradskyi]SMP03317.1 hypothetical protein SAMN06265367_101168 [Algoriphagus winogradskyi]